MSDTAHDVLAWRGHDLSDRHGQKIGSIEEIYLDAETRQPEWALVTTGLFGSKRSFVPIAEATTEGDEIRVPFDKDTVKDSPRMDPDGELSQREEADLYRHYGVQHSPAGSDAGTGEDASGTGEDVSGPNTDDAMTRSEEELHVGTAQRETGRARLRKYVVEDEVTQTVPVRREEVRIEREPITDATVGDATSGPDISEEEHEVVLHEEEPVAEKRVVPKERVRMDTDVHTDEREVSETVRKERVDVDDDTRRG